MVSWYGGTSWVLGQASFVGSSQSLSESVSSYVMYFYKQIKGVYWILTNQYVNHNSQDKDLEFI